MTNFERIKEMSVEELADEIYEYVDGLCEKCPAYSVCEVISKEHRCQKQIIRWLDSENKS